MQAIRPESGNGCYEVGGLVIDQGQIGPSEIGLHRRRAMRAGPLPSARQTPNVAPSILDPALVSLHWIESGPMPLSSGDKLGPYEIVSQIGAGGMGEVWKARDTRLDRIVAIKISKDEFTERFDREARAVAALNHPNICQLYDVGPNYLVMEFLEGAPLKGPLPVEKAAAYASQILDALDAAHRAGITHRDLKPANILLTRQGVKLLDFGLAKQNSAPLRDVDATLTKALTGDGQILGTLQYMSPEQLQAKPADARSDIFAFGCVLYELLSGQRAFTGDSAASVIAAILEREPAPIQVSPPLDRVLRTCLAKEPEHRFQTALDLKRVLHWALEAPAATVKAPNRRWPWAAAAGLFACLFGWGLLRPQAQPGDTQPIHLQLTPPSGGSFFLRNGFSLSPNGQTLAFAVTLHGEAQIWVRPLAGDKAQPLPGSQLAGAVFWSPDSRYLVFPVSGRQLFKADLAGGSPIPFAKTPGFDATGGDWNERDGILLGAHAAGLHRLPVSGGNPEPLTVLDERREEISHRSPQFLPGGRILFFIQSAKPENSGLYITSLLNPKERQRLVTTVHSGFSAGGYLLWREGERLVAQPFDPERRLLSGEPKTVLERVGSSSDGQTLASAAESVLAVRSQSTESHFRWFSSNGEALGSAVAQSFGTHPFRLSPDGTQFASVRNTDRGRDLWTVDLKRQTLNRLTFLNSGNLGFPIWSPDGRQILFSEGAARNLYRMQSRGEGTPQPAAPQSPYQQWPSDWSLDGRWILYFETSPKGDRDIWVMPVSPDGTPEIAKARPYLQKPFNDGGARFHPTPNPRWLAYESDATGRMECYLQAFPAPKSKWQISTNGGRFPTWSPDGRTVYFVSPDLKMMAVDIRLGADQADASAPRELFAMNPDVANNRFYDLSPDGKRFLIRGPSDDAALPLDVIVNWQALLAKKQPGQ